MPNHNQQTMTNAARNVGNASNKYGAAIRDGANVWTNEMNLDRPGGGAYLGGQASLRSSLSLIREMGIGGGGFTHGLHAGLSYLSGGETNLIQSRLQRMRDLRMGGGKGNLYGGGGGGKSLNQLMGETGLQEPAKQWRNAQKEKVAAVGREGSGVWDRKRFARAGVRSGAVAAGMAAVDFMNPFSMGWND